MRKLKLLSLLMLICFSVGNVWATEYTHTFATSTQSISGDVCTVTVADGHPLSIIAEKNGGSNFASYAPFRLYNKNKMTISANSGYVITQVDISFSSAQNLTVATDAVDYSYESYSFVPKDGEGNAASCSTVSFTNGNSSQARIASVTITYQESGSTPTCATPTFNPAAGSYEGTQNVTISSTADATIYYTTDDSDPTTSGTRQTYSSPIAVSADMTIKAYAVKAGYDDSEVAEAAYTITEGPDVTIAFAGNTNWNIPEGSSNKTVDEGTYTDGTYTIKIAGSTGEGYYINGYLLLGKTGAYVELPEFSNPIEKIVVEGTSGGSTGVKFNIYDGATAVSTEVTGCKNVNQEFTITNPAANKAYKVQVTSNANLQISAIKIYYGAAPAVAKPSISGDVEFLSSTEVTLACATDGATIYYTTNGSDPKEVGTVYSAPFSLSEGATVQAIAKVDDDWSDYASKTFMKVVPKTTAAELVAIATSAEQSVYVKLENWKVNYVNGDYAYIVDPSKQGVVLKQTGHGYVEGDVLGNEVFQVKAKLSSGRVQLSDFTSANISATSGSVSPDDVTDFSTLTAANQSALVTLKDATYDQAAGTFSDGEHVIYFYDQFNAGPALVDEANYDVTGIVIYYKSGETEKIEIAPRVAGDVVANSTVEIPTAANLAALKAAEKGTYILTLTGAIITYVNGKNAFIEEDNAGALIYFEGHGFVAGDKLDGDYQVNTEDYYGKFEITAMTAQEGATKTPDQAIPLTTLTIAQLNGNFANYESRRIKIEGVTVTDALVASSNDRNGQISDGTNSCALYAGIKNTIDAAAESYVNIIGYPGFNNENQQLTIWENADIQTLAPMRRIRFWNSNNWSSVKAHVWNNDGNVTEWPGEDAAFADGWNYFDVEDGNSILFHNNAGAQTANIENVSADACYVLTGETDGSGNLLVELDADCDDRFYVVGNEALTGQNWQAIRLVNGSVTFPNVAASEDLQFKINNGNWAWNRGYSAFDEDCSNVENWGDDNVGFSTTAAKDITISYDKVNDKICVQVADHVEPEYRAIVVSYGDKYYAMTTTFGNKGFAPLEVSIDGEGDEAKVIVESAADRSSILWKFAESEGTATFQNNADEYLAHTGSGTDLKLAAAEEVWTWNEAGYYYAVSGRTFFYQNTGNIFKNYSTENLAEDKTDYSGAPTFYAADKVIVSATTKVKFLAPVAWESVYVNTWDGTNNGNHQMTATGEGRWFECDIDKGAGFLFDNGEWGAGNQTVNIEAINAPACYVWAGSNNDGYLTVAKINSCEMDYYVTGDAALTGGNYTDEWPADAQALDNGSVTFHEIPANTYKFKITNGTWDWSVGYAYLDADACSGVTIESTDEDGNVVFSTADESDITITYNPATEKINVVASAATPKVYYNKVTSSEDITAGYYLIVNEENNVAFNGGTTALNASGNSINVTIDNGKIEVSSQMDAAAFFLDPEIGTIKSASGKYIGSYRASNEVAISDKIYAYNHESFTIEGENNDAVLYAGTFGSNAMSLRYNSGNDLFRYYKDYGQKPVQLYKKAEAAKASPAMAFASETAEATMGEAFEAPVLNHAEGVVASSFESSNESVATVDESGVVTLVSAGEAKIYALYAGNDTYRESYAAYTLTVNAAPEPPTPTKDLVRGELFDGKWGTLCPAQDVEEVEGAVFYQISYLEEKDGMPYNMEFVEISGTTLTAGQPYFFIANATEIRGNKTGAILEEADAAGVNGFYGHIGADQELTDWHTAYEPEQNNTYVIHGNKVVRINQEGTMLPSERCYININATEPSRKQDANPGAVDARRRITMRVENSNVATDIDALNASEAPVKMLIDGKMYILRGEKMYDATGRLVK